MKRWRREGEHWCTGGRRFSSRTKGALIQYLGVGMWNPVAWYYSKSVKTWPNTRNLVDAQRAIERWLARPSPPTRGRR